MSRPDWLLPPGVSRSLWEFAQDPQIARAEDQHLAGASLLDFDRQILADWFPHPGWLVDLGCGTGRLLADFVRAGWSTVGIDLSLESLRVARERAGDSAGSARLILGNLCELDFLPNARFDSALLMFGTLGMISGADHRQAALAHIHRILKPGGRLALHVHNVWRHLAFPAGRRWLLGDLWKRVIGDARAGDTHHGYRGIPNMYHHSFTRGEIRTALKRAGFSVREMLPLAPEPDLHQPPDSAPRASLVLHSRIPNLRATGWLILAERVEAN